LTLRVIGAGVGRTGTASLKVALQRLLGDPCYHMNEVLGHPDHVPVWHAAIHGEEPDWDTLLAGYASTVDWPAAAFWKPLSEAYPDALVLLSVRESAEEWFCSANATINELMLRPPPTELRDWHAMASDLLRDRFTPVPFDESAAKAAYERHNAEVRATVRSQRLLEWRVTDGWDPICERLGVAVPDEPFPHRNRRDEYRAVLPSTVRRSRRNTVGAATAWVARSAQPLVAGHPRVKAALGRLRVALPRPRPEDPVEAVIFEFARAYPRAVFIQVGANDGVYRDPLRDEIRARRWRGIMVEPVPHVFERLRATYDGNPRLILENAAIAEEDGVRMLYHLREIEPGDPAMPDWYDKLGSFHRDIVRKHARAIPDLDERLVAIEVPCLTFASLCSKHGIDSFDLVQIDTEGHDFEIVKLIDFDELRPRLVMYEHLHLDEATRGACSAHLSSQGYEQISDAVNTICLRTSDLTKRDRSLHQLWLKLRARDEVSAVPG
jgi:FkbM family methyltransferase